jgi:hypothetical protein
MGENANDAGLLHSAQDFETLGKPWLRRLTGPLAAGVVLALFWVAMLASLRNKSLTYDELGSATAGYTYWRFNDYRLGPEYGHLPQRVAAIPLAAGHNRFPSLEGEAWQTSDGLGLGYQWFYQMGNDAAGMAASGRAVAGLLAVALGGLVWIWSRRLFGPLGGALSLLLFVFSPTILANGALMTADTAVSLFFLASIGSLWLMLHRLTAGRVLLSALVMGGLFVSKMSAPLIVPVALTLLAARLLARQPLPVEIGSPRGVIVGPGRQALAFAAAAVIHLLVVLVVVWGCHGFRYASFAKAQPGRDRLVFQWGLLLEKPDPLALLEKLNLDAAQQAAASRLVGNSGAQFGQWTPVRMEVFQTVKREVLTSTQIRTLDAMLSAPPPTLLGRSAEFFRRHQLLPEAYLYGLTHTWRFSGWRTAFLNGRVSLTGWRLFFPYTFLVKTPLPVFAVIGLALIAAVAGRRRIEKPAAGPAAFRSGPAIYETLPLWVLLGFYWAAALLEHLNIGHRHLIPTYAPLFVLCGVAAFWLQELPLFGGFASMGISRPARAAGWALCGLIFVLAGEVLWRFPNYLAYFNLIAGGPAHGYRHLVDSSLDWGQDLPAVKRYLDQHKLTGPVYLSYFGNASPDYYLPPAYHVRYLHSRPGQDVAPPTRLLRLSPIEAEKTLAELLRQKPDYELAGRWREGDRLGLMLVKTPAALRLTGGTYFISATMLQTYMYDADGPVAAWNQWCETTYRQIYMMAKPLLDDDPAVRRAALGQHSPDEWQLILNSFEVARFQRLVAFLRRREPDDNVNFSILVYRLTDADISSALEGLLPE